MPLFKKCEFTANEMRRLMERAPVFTDKMMQTPLSLDALAYTFRTLDKGPLRKLVAEKDPPLAGKSASMTIIDDPAARKPSYSGYGIIITFTADAVAQTFFSGITKITSMQLAGKAAIAALGYPVRSEPLDAGGTPAIMAHRFIFKDGSAVMATKQASRQLFSALHANPERIIPEPVSDAPDKEYFAAFDAPKPQSLFDQNQMCRFVPTRG